MARESLHGAPHRVFIAMLPRGDRQRVLRLIGIGTLAASREEPSSSLLIAGARIADGTGAPLKTADVRVRGDRIVEVGTLTPANGERVVKADGLAAGKGVVVCKTAEDAVRAVELIMTREAFGEKAGKQIVVEKKLDGEEVSVLALVSGRTFLLLPACQAARSKGTICTILPSRPST